AITAGALIWGVVIYNLLVRDKNRVLAAWSDIDVQLKRRHDLIPKLVDAVKAYASYESGLVEEMTRLRADAARTEDPSEKGRLEGELSGRVRTLVAVAEAYPDLKASGQYLDLLRQLTDVENHIQYARRYYNGAVRNLNVRIESFPDMIVARALRFRPARFFELETATEGGPSGI
ncbi:MAG: LemA family protein, partial [Chromatiales bacterium]